jgi:hypothetical protein
VPLRQVLTIVESTAIEWIFALQFQQRCDLRQDASDLLFVITKTVSSESRVVDS